MPATLPPGTTPCKHFEICQLAATQGQFCILHFPQQEGKNIATFQQALDAHLASGRCDFRYVYFPAGEPPPYFDRRQFASVADFQGAVWSGTLRITEARFEEGLLFGGEQVGNVALQGSVVRGPLRLQAQAINNTLRLDQTVLEGSVDISVKSLIHFQAWKAQFCGHVSIHAAELGSLDLPHTELLGGLTLRARCQPQRNLYHVKIHGILDLGECEFIGGLSFADVLFGEDSTLDLSNSMLRGDLFIGERGMLPRVIYMNNTTIQRKTRLEAALGAGQPCVIARERPPRFEDEVTLTNVNLSECLLVGNVIQRIEFSDVKWRRAGHRWMLYDEAAYCSGEDIPLRRIRESYQVLKQKYAQMGDHVRAGDFHYGEMEMKRHEYGWRAGWEFLYWALSGYGTRPLRALVVLASLVLGFAIAYHYANPAAFGDFREALLFSLSATALQRPEVPTGVGLLTRALHVAQAILGPVQIALLVLALRMRLKR